MKNDRPNNASPRPLRALSETELEYVRKRTAKRGSALASFLGRGWPDNCSNIGMGPPLRPPLERMTKLTQPLLSQCRRATLALLTALSGLFLLIQPAAGSAQPSDRTSYVLLSPGSTSSTMSGSTEDLQRARALRNGREGLLYVRQDGAAYVIRDAATLRRAEAIFAPQRAMGARQAELGSRQAALGSRQAALGAQQARIGSRQANARPRQQLVLGRQQAELGRQQDALGRQQDALGRQQSALGHEQSRLAREADAKFRDLLADALRNGVAQRIN
jgi:hypothetical protein